MSRTAAAAALAAAALLGACTAPVTGSERLEISAPRWTLPGQTAKIDVTTRGALAERDVALTLMVNLKVQGRFSTAAGVATIPIPPARLRRGSNRIFVMTGSERAELEIVVVPAALPAAGLALIGAAAWLATRRRRRAAA